LKTSFTVAILETMEIDHILVFCSVAEAGGFTQAARALSIEKASVSKIIKKLETQVGIRLFERSTRKVRLTEAGQTFYVRGKALVEEANRLITDVQELKREVRGELKIAASPELGTFLCQKIIPRFSATYPELRISLILSYNYLDLLADSVDIAIRIGHPSESRLMAFKIGESSRGLYAAPKYLKTKGSPKHPRELAKHTLMAFRNAQREELSWVLSRGSETHEVKVDGPLSVENFQALAEGAIAGMGITVLPNLFFQNPIRRGLLVRVLPDWEFKARDIMAVYPARELKPAKLQAFLEFLRKVCPIHNL
jgi:DNA-binding transcriptional LysR family regulator